MPPVVDDYRGLTGPQKAAMMLLSLSDDQASQLFSLMDDEEIKELSQVMSSLGNVGSSTVERLFVEFVEEITATGSLVGSYDSTERLLAKALGEERVNGIMEEIRGPAGRTMWDKLGNVNEEVLASYLKNEYPQTVAVVLTKIKAGHAARVLGLLPEAFAMEVVMRMLRMETVQKEILDGIENRLKYEPTVQTRNRKRTRPNDAADWELRLGRFRVFYNVYDDVMIVSIEAVGFKIGGLLFIRGERVDL